MEPRFNYKEFYVYSTIDGALVTETVTGLTPGETYQFKI